MTRRLVVMALCLGIGLAACTEAEVTTMRLTSSAFSDGGPIPAEHTCDGGDVTPPLAWDDVPQGTQSFALVVTDPDARGFVHWVLTNIPADTRELGTGGGDAIGQPGRNDFGGEGWRGPCPPSGEHRYVFTLYALSAPMELGRGATADRVQASAQDTTLATGELTGVYARS